MDLWMVLVLFYVIRPNRAVKYELNDAEYSRLPPLVWLDGYASCLHRPGGQFCTAHASYVDGDPALLTLLQAYSENTSTRFNHSRALFARCVSHNCKSEEKTKSDPKRLLEGCLNRTVWDKYRLRVKLDDEIFCHGHGQKKPDVGTADIVVAAILLGLIMCNIVGSLFDICCTDKTCKERYVGEFFLFFSIPRNWKILTSPLEPEMECLRGIYGIRAISVALVIVAHSMIPVMVAPQNPKFIEELFLHPAMHIMLNGHLIMQTFLFVSAFLLVYCCQHRGIQLSWRNLPMGIVKRWLRLTPAYLLVLAVTATWLPYIGYGPLWDSMVGEESASCREVWWQHLLYINNYVEGTTCMRQTWYLAVDMQLHCVGLVVLVLWPGARVRLLAGLFLLGLLLPALHTYLQDMDGMLLVSPTSSSNIFANDVMFDVYIRTHTNMCSYILGLAAGFGVHAAQRNNFRADKYKWWRPVYWLLVPVGFLIPLSCQVFYSTPRVRLLYRVLTAALLKPIFGALMGAIIVGMVLNIESVYRGVLCWRGWVPLGRVSYSAYLLHVAYIRTWFGSLQEPIHLSILRGSEIAVTTVVIVNVLAFLFWLTVEAPLSHVVRKLAQRKPTKQHIRSKNQ